MDLAQGDLYPSMWHLLEGEFLVVGFDAAHIVRGGGVQGLHQQLQGVAELEDKTTRLEEGWRCCNPAAPASR